MTTVAPKPDQSDPLPSDLSDERLTQPVGLMGSVRAFGQRVRGGDLGSLPVVIGLILSLGGL